MANRVVNDYKRELEKMMHCLVLQRINKFLSKQIKKLPLRSSKIVQLLITHKANTQRNDQNRPKSY